MSLSLLQQRQWDDDSSFAVAVDGAPFESDSVLRLIPGKRLVAAGYWQDQAVIAKLFFNDQGKAAGHEQQVLTRLAGQGIRVPGVLGLERHGQDSVLLLEKVDGRDLHSLLHEQFEPARVTEVLALVWKLFQAGWLQQDLHAGNFLLTANGLCCLDAGAMRPVAATNTRALQDNLALFAVQSDLEYQQPLITQTAQAMAGWGLDVSGFEQRCRRQLRRRIHKADKKWSRNCTAIQVSRQGDALVYRERQGNEAALLALCEAPQQLPLLKAGSRVRVYGDDHWVLKHYCDTSLKARFKQRLGWSRAMVSWVNGHSWALLGIPTPAPAMLLEYHRGERAGESVIAFPRVPGVQLSRLMEQQRQRALQVAEQVRAWLQRLGWAGLYHGDMKAQNILVGAQDELYFIDLDGAQSHRWQWQAQRLNRKDQARFERNWEQFKG